MTTTEAAYFRSLPGDFSVDSNGGTVYSIPLQLPPGTAGMMPTLSIVYSSGGNGILGMGWSLQGLSSITRVGATVAQDGFFGAVTYGSDDRFSLDEQRLVPISGSAYQDPSTIYHTEIESWQKVVPVYNTPSTSGRNGPDTFLIYTKDGKCMEYGTSSDAQILASATNPSIRVWTLNRITDLNGNYLTITYQQDQVNNSFYPSHINYTGNSVGGLAPQRSVQFSYQSRLSGADSVPHYLGGYVVEGNQLLQNIQTFLDNQLVMTYSFNVANDNVYKQGAATGRSHLVSVTVTDATGVSLPSTIFTYQDGNSGIFSACPPLTPAPSWT